MGSEIASGETALVVEVTEVEELVGPWRLAHDPGAQLGIPAHVTALYPFVEPDDLDESVIAGLGEVVSTVRPFEFELTDIGAFPNAVWLRPSPDDPFRRLTEAIWAAFPDYPPYGGKFLGSQPHLTVAKVEAEEAEEFAGRLRDSIGHHLPVSCRATSLTVCVSDDGGGWRREAVLPLG